MSRLLVIKVLQAIPVLLLVSVLAFLLMSLLPGDPAVVIAGDQASPEAIEKVRRTLGLDRPFLEQIGLWFGQLVRGNFGNSLMLNQSVLSAMGERLPVTLSLAGLSLAITLPIGILVGSIAAYYRQTWINSAVMAVALLGVSIPGFWIAILAVILFCGHPRLAAVERVRARCRRIRCCGCARSSCRRRCCRCSRSASSPA